MLDYDELLFIKAEAAMNGWISGSAKEYYEAAITASCQKWGEYGIYASYPELNASNKIELKTVAITQKNIAALLASDHVKWNNTQQRLAEQKWLSLFWVIGFQMYHEMRRTGYPECKTGMGTIELNARAASSSPAIPIRRSRSPTTVRTIRPHSRHRAVPSTTTPWSSRSGGAARPSPRMPGSRGNTRSARMSSPKRTYNLKTNAL